MHHKPGIRSSLGGGTKGTSSDLKPLPEKRVSKAVQKPREPWRPRVGSPCTFYYEGGRGDNYWSGGWHYGIIREIPTKGQHLNWVRIELPADLYGWDPVKRRWYIRDKPRAWVYGANVNEAGDCIYHGPRLTDIVAERKQEKAQDQAKAERRKHR